MVSFSYCFSFLPSALPHFLEIWPSPPLIITPFSSLSAPVSPRDGTSAAFHHRPSSLPLRALPLCASARKRICHRMLSLAVPQRYEQLVTMKFSDSTTKKNGHKEARNLVARGFSRRGAELQRAQGKRKKRGRYDIKKFETSVQRVS